MVSKQWAGTLSALTIILAVLCVAAPAMAATWVVNPDGSGNFTTIQAAVDSDWTSGDTIQIEYADYKEPVFVDAEGGNLTIAGVLSAEGELPVIDGMYGAIALDGPDDTFDQMGCGACSLYLYNGNFIVSDLCIINATKNGLVARAGGPEQVFSATGIEVTENGWFGMNVMYFAEVALTDIVAYENYESGIHLKSNDYAEVTDVLCFDNGGAGLHIRGDRMVVDGVEATGNGWRGVFVCLENGYRDNAFDNQVIVIEPPVGSECILTNIFTANNGDDGLFVKDEGLHDVTISWIESVGNGGNGIGLNNLYGFSATYLILSENGWESGPINRPLLVQAPASVERQTACDDDEMLDGACRGLGYGNGIGVLGSGDGYISHVESINNSVAGVYLKRTEDITLRYVEAAEHSPFFPVLMDQVVSYSAIGAGISEKITEGTVIEDCLAFNNYVDYAYEGQCDQVRVDGEVPPSSDYPPVDVTPAIVLPAPSSGYPTVTRLQISDPFNEHIVPTILSWDSDCDLLWIGQPGGAIDNFNPPARYHDAGGIYAEVMGASGDTVELTYIIPPEFPSVTAEGLSVWNCERNGEGWDWVRPLYTYNTLVGEERLVGVNYTFPGDIELMVDSTGSFDAAGWDIPDPASGMDGYSGNFHETTFAPFWYAQPSSDDASLIVTENPASGTSGDAGTGTGVGDSDVTPTAAPVLTAGPDEGDGGNVTPPMTPPPVGESPPPTVPVTQMPADAGASGNGGFLPWAVLLVVLIAIGGGAYYMKSQQK